MKTKRNKRLHDRAKAFVLLIILCFLLTPVQAQQPVHHNCWDLPPVSSNLSPITTNLSPIVIHKADSGLMLIGMAKEYLGARYRYGGRSPKGFDCAGFALFLYRHFGHDLPGWSGAQAKLGIEVSDTRNLMPGDLVFFGGRHSKHIVGHTGIVVSTDTTTGVFRFIHASTGAGVIISTSTEPYYKQRYITAKRLFH